MLGACTPKQSRRFFSREAAAFCCIGFPFGGSSQWPRPLTDEGQVCHSHPFAGSYNKRAPHPKGRLQRVEKPPSAREVPRRGGGREPCHSPKYFGQPYSSLPHRLRAEPPRRGGQGVSTPFSTVCHPSPRCSDSGWFVGSGLDRSVPAGGTGKHPGEG